MGALGGATLMLLGLCLLVQSPACSGESTGPKQGVDQWPVALDLPAVLGYACARSEGQLARGLSLLGWEAQGLDDSRPEVLLFLDPTVLGAPLALLPVLDGARLEASLEASPLAERLNRDRFRITLPSDHPMRAVARLLKSGAGIRSLGDVMQLLQDVSPLSVTLSLHVGDGWVTLAPSFEASYVARQALTVLPLHRAEPGLLAWGLDVERVTDTFHEDLQGLEAQVRGLLSGSQTAGLAGVVSQLSRRGKGDGDGPFPNLPITGEALWALTQMLSLADVARVGGQLSGLAFEGAGLPSRRPGQALELRTRVERSQPSLATRLLQALRPAPAFADGLSLEADPDAFAAAMVEWVAPLASLVRGEGAPARRWAAELGQLLSPWSGRLQLRLVWPVMDSVVMPGARTSRPDGVVVVLGTRNGQRFDGDALMAWFDELREAALLASVYEDMPWGGLSSLKSLPYTGAHVYFAADIDADDLMASVDEVLGSEAPDQGPHGRVDFMGFSATFETEGLAVWSHLSWRGDDPDPDAER